jgi:hypothetical protein
LSTIKELSIRERLYWMQMIVHQQELTSWQRMTTQAQAQDQRGQ